MDVAEVMSSINRVTNTTEIMTTAGTMAAMTTEDMPATTIIAVQHTVNPAIVACLRNG